MATDLNKMTVDELRKKAAQNSEEWFGADSAKQNALHNENV